jgi:hypothetical protein
MAAAESKTCYPYILLNDLIIMNSSIGNHERQTKFNSTMAGLTGPLHYYATYTIDTSASKRSCARRLSEAFANGDASSWDVSISISPFIVVGHYIHAVEPMSSQVYWGGEKQEAQVRTCRPKQTFGQDAAEERAGGPGKVLASVIGK